jgi:hypothetical protein
MRPASFLLTLMLAGCGGDDGSTSTTTTTGDSTAASTVADSTVTPTSGTSGGTSGGTGTTAGTTGGLPAGSCRTDADCDDIENCARPGSVECSGATFCDLDGPPCLDDAECGGTPDAPQICVPDPCCPDSICQPGCVDAGDCGLAQACGDDGRCVAASCDMQVPCPPNYTCEQGTCAVTTCESDAPCDGFCVVGQCSVGLGTCSAPKP